MAGFMKLTYIADRQTILNKPSAMILSSADIAHILGSNEIIRLSAHVQIVDGKPPLTGAEGIHIYINRFPKIDEFESTWTLWIESDDVEPSDLVIAELKRILPKVEVAQGLMTTIKTTDFATNNTQKAPPVQASAVPFSKKLAEFESRFEELIEDVQDRMLLVTSGRPGRDGASGRDGKDGRPGKDIDSTKVSIFDLVDTEQGLPLQRGQVMMWDGTRWTNLYVPQVLTRGGGGGGGGAGVIISETAPTKRADGGDLEHGDEWWDCFNGRLSIWYDDGDTQQWVQSALGPQDGGSTGTISDAPIDGIAYVRKNGSWIDLGTALEELYPTFHVRDGGNFTTGASIGHSEIYDGGNFNADVTIGKNRLVDAYTFPLGGIYPTDYSPPVTIT